MINHFFECLVPVSVCNLKCEYCYVIQENRRNIATPPCFADIDKWEKAIKIERIGKCFFSFCGYGETLIRKEPILSIIKSTLTCGHIVNITCNGTMTDSINSLISLPATLQRRLLISFSLHYDELKKRNLLDIFTTNVTNVIKSDISCFVQINLVDDYIDEIDTIKKFCYRKFGCLPHVALTRKENEDNISIYSKLEPNEYKKQGDAFDSKLFEYTFSNFNVQRSEFCHAGEYSFSLDLASGDLRRCYDEPPFMNIFDETIDKMPKTPIGRHCKSRYCINSSHFLSLGNIHDFRCETYAELRNREINWIKNDVLIELSEQFAEEKKDYGLKLNGDDSEIILYGAGVAGREVLHYLKNKKKLPMAFVVSDGIKNVGGYRRNKSFFI